MQACIVLEPQMQTGIAGGMVRGPGPPGGRWAMLRRSIVWALAGMFILSAGMSHGLGQPGGSAAIYLFWGDGCPHCEQAMRGLEGLLKRHPGSELRAYEVWYDENNAKLFASMAAAHGFAPSAVPTIMIGKRYWVGFSPGIAPQIESVLVACLNVGCPDAGAGVIPATGGSAAAAEPRSPVAGPEVIDLPFIGAVDLTRQSLWVSTAVISLVDGFNPCSLWVLSILVALSLHAGSRKTVLFIGLIFITVTAAVYALFIAGLFTVLSMADFVGIRVVVALIALAFGAVNTKDYFFYKKGLSFTIDDSRKPVLYRGMRRVLDAGGSMWGLAGATVVLAAGVSLIEFSCTAGFPVLWTNLLAAQQVPTLTFALLLMLYMLLYQLDELALFLAAVVTLKAVRLEEHQGRILKLIGGILMVTLAGVMLVNPALMNRLGTSLGVFGVAFAITGLVLLLHRRVLPSLGVRLGDEAQTRTPRL